MSGLPIGPSPGASPTMSGNGFQWYGGQPLIPEGGTYNQMAQDMAGPSYAPQGSNFYSGLAGALGGTPGGAKGASPGAAKGASPGMGAKGASPGMGAKGASPFAPYAGLSGIKGASPMGSVGAAPNAMASAGQSVPRFPRLMFR